MQEHIHIQEIITSLIYNVNPHQSNAALSFSASEQEKRTHNILYVLFPYVKSNIILRNSYPIL